MLFALFPKPRCNVPEFKYIELGPYLDYFLYEHRSYPNSSAKQADIYCFQEPSLIFSTGNESLSYSPGYSMLNIGLN